MAKKRHHKKKHHTRRRRHSAMSGIGGDMTNVLAMVAGAIAGRMIQNKLESKVSPKLVAAGQVAAGIFLPKFIKNKFVSGIGTGMIVNGGVTLANQFGVVAAVSGLGADYSLDYVSGTDNLSILAGGVGVTDQGIMTGDVDRLSVLAGDMEDMSGMDDDSEY
jgi:hypothetical protein